MGRVEMPGAQDKVAIAVVGAGAIGRKHIAALAQSGVARLVALVDPSVSARALAAQMGVAAFATLDALLAAGVADAAILATPTPAHFPGAMACVAAGLPVLVEKPVTVTPAEAAVLAAAAAQSGVPVLVGHHRRHNPLMQRAREIVQRGDIGRIVALHTTTWFLKPDDYFLHDWRRAPGAGPMLTNLIHDVDLMRWIVGDVVSVQATASSAVRGFATEDTAVAILRFANGALGTMSVSDAAVSPWSWELTSGENPDYPVTGQSCYMISGTQGALDLPRLTWWSYAGAAGWHAPLQAQREPVSAADPLARQIDHFAAVVRGTAAPIITVADAARSLTVVDAIARAAQTGATVEIPYV